jgi:four helix bundle protein
MPEKQKISRYEDLIAWQSSDELADLVDAMVSKGPAAQDEDFRRQIKKSSSKAPAQIAEGFVRYKPKESAYYYRVARASLAETQNHLRRGYRRKYWSEEEFKKAWDVSETALKTTTGLLQSRLEKIAEEERQKRKREPTPKAQTSKP